MSEDKLNEHGFTMFMRDTLKMCIFNQILESIMEEVTDFETLPLEVQLRIHGLMRTGLSPHKHLAKTC